MGSYIFIVSQGGKQSTWGLVCQEQVYRTWISNYNPQDTVGCNYLSMAYIPASGTHVLMVLDPSNTSHTYTIIGSENGLSPGQRQAFIWTNAGMLLIGPLGTKFSEILIKIHTFSSKKTHLKMSSAKVAAILSRPQCVKPASPQPIWLLLH